MSTPERYFGGAPNAFQGGVEFSAAQRARRLHENALNALIAQYGPTAADPAAAAAMQGVEQSAAQQPYVMSGMQRTDTARNAAAAQYGPIAGDPATQAEVSALETHNNARRLAAGQGAARVLQSVKEKHGDIGQAFDFIQQALPAIGIPPEHLATLRQALVEDPESVDEFVHLLQDPSGHKALSSGVPMRNNATGKLEWVIPTENGYRTVPGYTPANAEVAAARVVQGDVRNTLTREKLDLGWKNLDFSKFKEFLPAREQGVQLSQDPEDPSRVVASIVPGSPAEQKLNEKLDALQDKDRKFTRAFETVSQHGDVVTSAAQRALQYFNEADAGVLVQSLRSGAGRIPGTRAYEVNRLLNEIKNNIKLDEIQRMRQNSTTGGALGNVSDKDMDTVGGALGQLEIARDPEAMRDNLNRILTDYTKIIDFARQDADRAQSRSTLREQRAAPRRPASSTPTGQPSLDDLLNHYAPVQ
jgi:hypothetical protein